MRDIVDYKQLKDFTGIYAFEVRFIITQCREKSIKFSIE